MKKMEINKKEMQMLSIEDLLNREVEIDGIRVLWTADECEGNDTDKVIINAGEYPKNGDGFVHFIGFDYKSKNGNILWMTIEVPLIISISSIVRNGNRSICVKALDEKSDKPYRLMLHSAGFAEIFCGLKSLGRFKKN